MQRACTLSFIFLLAVCNSVLPGTSWAGVTNPNISALGQIIASRGDDASSENANRTVLDLGETELVLDAYLNPYAKGFFVFSISNDGLETEEAYLTIFKGLPKGLALKCGKYRIGFGKLNPAHPHTYPFIEAPRVLSAMLPGEDGFNDIGVQASVLLPTFGSWASILSIDLLNGSSFHPDETKSAPGWVGRWSNSFLIKDVAPMEIGLTATRGTNNVRWKAETDVYGADVKMKIPFSPLTQVTLQGEYFYNDSRSVIDSLNGSAERIKRSGFYVFADLRFRQRYDAGIIYDRYKPRGAGNLTDSAVKCFLGYSLMEETTLFRLAYEDFMPEGSPDVHSITFQILYSMGPHKAHQF